MGKTRSRKCGFILGMIIFVLMLGISGSAKTTTAKLYLSLGEQTVLPLSSTGKALKWKTSNKKVASVNGGTVTGKKFGSATLTAKEKSRTWKYTIIVRNPKVAQRFLGILDKYSQQIQRDYNSSKMWHYGGNVKSTFYATRNKMRRTTCLYQLFFALREMKIMKGSGHFNISKRNKLTFSGKTKSQLLKHGEILNCKGKYASTLIANGSLQEGDICAYAAHFNVYAGNGQFYDTGRNGVGGYFLLNGRRIPAEVARQRKDWKKLTYCMTSGGPFSLPYDRKIYYIIRLNY